MSVAYRFAVGRGRSGRAACGRRRRGGHEPALDAARGTHLVDEAAEVVGQRGRAAG